MYYNPARVCNFWNKNFVGYKSNNSENKNVSVKEYPNEIKPYLRDIITDLQKSVK